MPLPTSNIGANLRRKVIDDGIRFLQSQIGVQEF
jgi:hypothetical protein